MSFGAEYSDNYAHFIAGGRTLDLIRQYEDDVKNSDALKDAFARELGARQFIGNRFYACFIFDHEDDNPALVKIEPGNANFIYTVNRETAEGQALQERLSDIPEKFELGGKLFARRLTGADSIATNPDGLQENEFGGNSHYAGPGKNEAHPFYQQYGDTYVVSVPRVIRGVFNQAAADKAAELHFIGSLLRMSAGYRYEWFTPPDSTPVPYSKVIELREKQLGDQTAPRQVSGSMFISDMRPD